MFVTKWINGSKGTVFFFGQKTPKGISFNWLFKWGILCIQGDLLKAEREMPALLDYSNQYTQPSPMQYTYILHVHVQVLEYNSFINQSAH